MNEEHLPIKENDREEMEKYYNMDGDTAQTLWNKWLADGQEPKDEDPFKKWVAVQKIKQWHKQFKKGDKQVVLPSLSECIRAKLPIPRWVELAFLSSCDDARYYRLKSWDEAFGKPYPKNARVESRRDWLKIREALFVRVRKILTEKPDTRIDSALFERVAQEFNISRSDANTMYYEVKNHTERLLAGKNSKQSKWF